MKHLAFSGQLIKFPQWKQATGIFRDGFWRASFNVEDTSRIHIYEPKQLGKHRLTEVGFDHRPVKYLWRDVIHEISSENEYRWGSKGAPSEGPSGEDDSSDTQWGFFGPNAPFKMKGGRDQSGLKWRPISEGQSGTGRWSVLSCPDVCPAMFYLQTVVAYSVVD